ncbi:MAG: hypothetical protein JST00_00305 [Deltaproteobacteria bacterium]|nr:hypothetical protein [Deltaproteobacteria bacterium]
MALLDVLAVIRVCSANLRTSCPPGEQDDLDDIDAAAKRGLALVAKLEGNDDGLHE